MLGSDPPPRPRHGRKGSPSPKPPPGTATKEGKGGVGQMGFRAIPPPQSNFLPALGWAHGQQWRMRHHPRGYYDVVVSCFPLATLTCNARPFERGAQNAASPERLDLSQHFVLCRQGTWYQSEKESHWGCPRTVPACCKV